MFLFVSNKLQSNEKCHIINQCLQLKLNTVIDVYIRAFAAAS